MHQPRSLLKVVVTFFCNPRPFIRKRWGIRTPRMSPGREERDSTGDWPQSHTDLTGPDGQRNVPWPLRASLFSSSRRMLSPLQRDLWGFQKATGLAQSVVSAVRSPTPSPCLWDYRESVEFLTTLGTPQPDF